MNPCCTNHGELIYSPGMMTPPPEDLDCNLEVRPPRYIFSFREPPTPESLPRVTAYTTPTNRHHPSISTNQVRRRSTATSDSIFSPREPSELLRERDYIGLELQRQSDKKRDFIRQYSAAEGNFNSVSVSNAKQKRRMRKKLSKLRGLLSEAGNNERTLAIRWSELCLELRSHETWAQAQWERRRTDPAEYFTLSPLSITQDASSASELSRHRQSSLVATSPVFVPRGMSLDEVIAGHPQGNLETVQEAGEECTQTCHEGFGGQDQDEQERTGELESQRRCSYDDEIFPPRERRLSLPNMQAMWH